jgi:hypothetical protein
MENTKLKAKKKSTKDIIIKEEPNLRVYFNCNGKADGSVTEKTACARSNVVDEGNIYYIKVDAKNDPFNPEKDSVTKIDRRTGNPVYRWRRVKPEVFNLYIKFLLTSDTSIYRNVKRNF